MYKEYVRDKDFSIEAIDMYMQLAICNEDKSLYKHLFNVRFAIQLYEKIKRNGIKYSAINAQSIHHIHEFMDMLYYAYRDGVGELVEFEFIVDSLIEKNKDDEDENDKS
jgi:hypothetical protein